jgi:fused signal recognition particle receptor
MEVQRFVMMKWFKRRDKKAKTRPGSEQVEELDVEAEPGPAEATGTDRESAPEHEGPSDMAAEPGDVGKAAFDEVLTDTTPPQGEAEQPESRRFFRKLRERMHKTREQLTKRVDRLVLGKKQIDLDLLDDLEEVLITSD